MHVRTAAVMQTAAPVAAALDSGRAVLGGGVADPVVWEAADTGAYEDDTFSRSKPGLQDRLNFKQHWSVDFWKDFSVPPSISDPSTPIPSRLQAILQTLTEAASSMGVFSSSKAAAYWGYHITRSSFFALQGIAGVLAARAASSVTGTETNEVGIRMESMIRAGLTGPIGEALAMYYQDYKNIEEGVYKLPWDMTTRGHRQWSPFWIARRSAQFVAEASAALGRRDHGKPEDVWLKSPMYPDYYLNTFHYQTDGWLSERSARVYEVSTETLFLGRQDAMQRQSLVPLRAFMAARPRDGAGTRLLEVASGTGRFATFLKDNYPRMDVTLADLSPYYLQEARKNMRYWADMRAPGQALGGADGAGVSYLQAPAEAISQPDNSYDVVTCVYLFHELPPEVRRAAAAEMARVLRPGGLLVFTDSIQLGDREQLDPNLGRFGDFNEPYYLTYISEDFGKLFKDVGLECDTKLLASSSKVLSFRKPLQPKPAAAPATVQSQSSPSSPQTAGEECAEEICAVPAS
ncbi:S-adenosyl-L-methionine-dependent methyltransferase [Coccomyxa subellipsoidea C-169]|uniref:S-adenosyl-L-methionine-dependent methyltransferase n=1 Tax=Coccomyxa subellipsoidea (strain C-169) TaxID=574566 RepID=I0ZAG2_COCSC|nr:S-adenosyl-L-methionine-dependent methyltransferase [Coccomyxa subellipsoidea C-169]EIE27631.1 S-adenosyl-L-methionine-dependent methyltransferase [Coccomyxa subellipsoidea C-169]|eukprot:XP_005652175.1 S-adenosyl-L-methionine-dependent methyltransferase [Coccomyxa subellipsoidea C-169]